MRRTQTVHLIGGGPGTFRALRKHFRAALEDIAAERPLVAYVGVASNDNGAFYTMIRGGLALSGARFRMAKMASARSSAAEARALLDECDLVFMSGGDVDHGMRVLRDKDMLPTFRRLARAGKPMFGISAGSIMLARAWVRFPDDDEAKAEIFACLGIVPVYLDAHAEADDWSELRTLLRMLHSRGDGDLVGYGLTRGGGLQATVDGADVTMRAIGTPIPRLVVRGDRIVAAAPLR
ncbi:MAG: Type 1 glutamine amidotransferase-like domain-containing protein [Polyangiaceae bacterium]|jgi:peptidase E